MISGDGKVKKHELRLPKKGEIVTIVVVGDDLAIFYRDEKYQGRFFWSSDPAQHFDSNIYSIWRTASQRTATVLEDGSVFLGEKAARTGDKQMPESQHLRSRRRAILARKPGVRPAIK